jgi:hypothetical protein
LLQVDLVLVDFLLVAEVALAFVPVLVVDFLRMVEVVPVWVPVLVVGPKKVAWN